MTDSWPHELLDWYRAHARDLPWRNPPGAALPGDPTIVFVTKQESLDRLTDRSGTDTLALMPQAFEVTTTDPASVEAAFADLAALPGVAVLGRAPAPEPSGS